MWVLRLFRDNDDFEAAFTVFESRHRAGYDLGGEEVAQGGRRSFPWSANASIAGQIRDRRARIDMPAQAVRSKVWQREKRRRRRPGIW